MLTLFATENQIELREVEYFVSKTKLHKSTGEDNISLTLSERSVHAGIPLTSMGAT